MKRVYIAVALAVTMLFGSSAFAGGKSFNIQLDAHNISVNWSSHYQRGKQYRRPHHWQKRRVVPRRNVRHAPRRIYRAPKRVYRPAPRRAYRAPKRVYRPAPRRVYKAPRRIYRAPKRVHKAPKRVYRAPARKHYKRPHRQARRCYINHKHQKVCK